MDAPKLIIDLAQSTPARVGLAVESLDGTWGFVLRPDEVFTQASAIKIPILWELHRQAAAGELSLAERLTVDPANGAGGCGLLQHFLPGASQMSLGDLGVAMILLSDNVATNLLIDRLGFDPVNALLAGIGVAQTRLRRKMIDLEARKAGRENTSTPAEAVRLMRRLHDDETTSDPVAAAVLKVLRIRKRSPVVTALPKEMVVATKPGMLDGLRTEWSIVEHHGVDYAQALMSDGAPDSVLEPLFRQLATAIRVEACKLAGRG
jgi:beta-lactamase class A